ncbi:MAG TPA: DUF3343 domain-containing protein [Clostridiaceae bacterium]|nr:DUF3343 domain-containing protein [Clostridiaceae bacterium]
MEYIITFANTNNAIKAESCLLNNEIQVSVLPLPPSIKAGCGICLRLKEDDLRLATQLLESCGIKNNGIYFKKGRGREVSFQAFPEQ